MLEPVALPRGALMHAERVEGARSFSLGFWFPVGSRHEAPRERGFVHFVEHLLFKGTASRTALDIARAFDRVGGYVNAFTERDCLCVHCTVPARHWALAIDLLFDMCFGSSFPAGEVEKEREVIVSEILAARDDPEEFSHDLFLERIWGDHPLARTIAGSEEDVRGAAREDLLEFRLSALSPGRLLVSLSGPVDGALCAGRLGRLLETLPGGGGAGAPAAETEPPFSSRVDSVSANLSQAYLLVAIPLHPPFAEDDWYVLSALNGAFGESMSSRLFQGLRERDGLCYSVISGFSLGRTEGLWVAQASSSARTFPALLESLCRELEDMGGRRPLTGEELSESLSRLEGAFDLSLDEPESRMRRLARQELHAGGALSVEETRTRILDVDADRAARMTERLFASPERAIFAYGKIGERGRKALDRARGGIAGAGGGHG